ncbi:hypothetical protein BTW15_05525 [Pseudomonas syringae pv. tomato]|uniref:Uncharacterized protein n=1 Tax=Pseudomonas syringae pv. tomato TaxID=323 RepID=A0AB36L0G7_PSEUB|nr:hypothetical protein BTW15_05525 [Pseudomonas syringae pv. tomato]
MITEGIKVFSGDVRGPDDLVVALPQQAFQLTGRVGRPGNVWHLPVCGAHQCGDGAMTGKRIVAGGRSGASIGVGRASDAWTQACSQM